MTLLAQKKPSAYILSKSDRQNYDCGINRKAIDAIFEASKKFELTCQKKANDRDCISSATK